MTFAGGLIRTSSPRSQSATLGSAISCDKNLSLAPHMSNVGTRTSGFPIPAGCLSAARYQFSIAVQASTGEVFQESSYIGQAVALEAFVLPRNPLCDALDARRTTMSYSCAWVSQLTLGDPERALNKRSTRLRLQERPPTFLFPLANPLSYGRSRSRCLYPSRFSFSP